MNRIEEKAHPYADEIPQMEICDTEAVVPGQQKSDSITTHNDSQGSHQCRRNETFVFSDKVKIKIIQPTTAPIKNGAKCLSINTYIKDLQFVKIYLITRFLHHKSLQNLLPSIIYYLSSIFVATGRIELPLPNHRSGVAFGGFPTGLDTGSRPVCYPTRLATHGDATGRLFTVQTRKGARSAGRRNKLKRKLSFGMIDKIIKRRTY